MKTRYTKGYSLLETLIYMSIFAVLVVGVSNSLIATMKSFALIRSNRDLQSSGYAAMERITREIRHASDVDTVASTLGTSPGVLVLDTTDESGNPKTVEFEVSGSTLVLNENGSSSGNLTGETIEVSSLMFTNIATSNGNAIRIALTITDERSPTGSSKSFYDTVVLRGSY